MPTVIKVDPMSQMALNTFKIIMETEMYTLFDRTSAQNSGQTYTLNFDNQSTNTWSLLCFQQQPTGLPMDYFSLAWFSKMAVPNSKVTCRWQIDYSFIWQQTGLLRPGVKFTASQNVASDGLTKMNQIDFGLHQGQAYGFTNQQDGPAGALTINQASTIPNKQASVGIGMSGGGTFVVQAQPNIKASFVPTPTYYIAFAQSVQEGEVLNISQLTAVQEIKFPVNEYEVTATLTAGNTWDVTSGSSDAIKEAMAASLEPA